VLQDAFDDCLYEMSQSRHRLYPRDLISYKSIESASDRTPDLYMSLLDMLAPYGLTPRFQETFMNVSERQSRESWVFSLLEHHCRIQRIKPPNGRAPWLERFDDGSYLLRPAHLRDKPGLHRDEYVHYYRTGPVVHFTGDLGMVK